MGPEPPPPSTAPVNHGPASRLSFHREVSMAKRLLSRLKQPGQEELKTLVQGRISDLDGIETLVRDYEKDHSALRQEIREFSRKLPAAIAGKNEADERLKIRVADLVVRRPESPLLRRELECRLGSIDATELGNLIAGYQEKIARLRANLREKCGELAAKIGSAWKGKGADPLEEALYQAVPFEQVWRDELAAVAARRQATGWQGFRTRPANARRGPVGRVHASESAAVERVRQPKTEERHEP